MQTRKIRERKRRGLTDIEDPNNVNLGMRSRAGLVQSELAPRIGSVAAKHQCPP